MFDSKALEKRMEKSVDAFENRLSSIRAGRANPKLLEGITFPYYGVDTPLHQAATIAVPEARMITITPWDAHNLGPIKKAILGSDLGITPTDDGKVIRLPFPPLTEERRKSLVKETRKLGEEAKVALRNIRREEMDHVKKAEKAGEITEDDRKDAEEGIQKVTDRYVKKLDDVAADKERELMEI